MNAYQANMVSSPSSVTLRHVAALGVFLAGGVVTGGIVWELRLDAKNPLPGILADISDTALLTASWQLGGLLLLMNRAWFLPIVTINAWHRRRGAAAYGLTRTGHSWSALAIGGLGTAAFSLGSTLVVNLANTLYNLGETVALAPGAFSIKTNAVICL